MSISAVWLILLGAGLFGAENTVRAQPPPATQAEPDRLQDLRQRAMQEGESGNTEEAIRDYSKALAIDPTWKEGRWNLGMLQYSANRFAEAQSTFQQVVQFAPGLGIAWGLLGLSEFEIGSYAYSLEHLQKAQSVGIQEDAEVRRISTYHLALLLIRSGEFERASELLTADFGGADVTAQVKTALGLAMLRIPLLPDEVDPSQDALVSSAGDLAVSGADNVPRFAAVLAAYPNVPYLHYDYGMALAKAGRAADATSAFRAESQISPQSPLPWIQLSRLEQDQPEAARHAAKMAAELASASPSPEPRIVQRYANTQRAGKNTLVAQKNWEQAMREYSSAQYEDGARDLKDWLAANPQNGTGWAMLGLCEFAMKDYDNALIHLDRGSKWGLSGSPESVQTARSSFGILLVRAGYFDRAMEVLAAAYPTGSPDPIIQTAFGLALLRRAEPATSEGKKQPDFVVRAGQIAMLLQQSKYDEAFPLFRKLLAAEPSVPYLHYAFGTALLALSQFEEADAQMHEEIAISPRSELPLLRLASIALRQRKANEATDWAQHALHLAPQSVEAHYLLGRALLEIGDDAGALRELESAEQLQPGSPEIHFNLAKAYDRAQLPAKATEEREIFSRLKAASETQQPTLGSQIDSGPRSAGDMTKPAAESDASPHL